MKAYPLKVIKRAAQRKSPEEIFQEKMRNAKFRKKYNKNLFECLKFIEENKDRLRKWIVSNPVHLGSLQWNNISYDHVPYTEDELVEMFNKQHFKKNKVRLKDVKKMRLL